MFAGMIEIHDLEGTGEMLIGEVPDPDSPVGEDHPLLSPAPPPPPCFDVNSFPELFASLDGSNLGFTVDLAGAAFCFRLHDGHTGAVHLDIQHWNGLAQDLRKLQLQGAPHFHLLPSGQVSSDCFGMPLHSLFVHLQARQ